MRGNLPALKQGPWRLDAFHSTTSSSGVRSGERRVVAPLGVLAGVHHLGQWRDRDPAWVGVRVSRDEFDRLMPEKIPMRVPPRASPTARALSGPPGGGDTSSRRSGGFRTSSRTSAGRPGSLSSAPSGEGTVCAALRFSRRGRAVSSHAARVSGGPLSVLLNRSRFREHPARRGVVQGADILGGWRRGKGGSTWGRSCPCVTGNVPRIVVCNGPLAGHGGRHEAQAQFPLPGMGPFRALARDCGPAEGGVLAPPRWRLPSSPASPSSTAWSTSVRRGREAGKGQWRFCFQAREWS